MNAIALIIILVDIVIILILIPTVILQRRESGATLAWILAIVLLPYIGLLLFWIFGIKRLYFKRRKRNHAETQISANLTNNTQNGSGHSTLKDISPSLINLATNLDKKGPQVGNKVTLFRSGIKTFNAIEKAIESSTNHVHLVYYLWENDSTGQRIVNALLRACQRGVEIRILIDGLGSRATKKSFFYDLIESGGIVERFLPINIINRHFNLNNRNHRKLIIIDGEIGFTGGMNIGDDYSGLGKPWLDLHAKICGPAVYSLQEVFCQDWYHTTECDLTSSNYFPESKKVGNTWVQVLSSGPADERWKNIYTLFFASINSAKNRVWIETPYFVPDSSLVMSLQTAALRGVDVRLLLPSKSDHPLVLYAGRSFYNELMHAGVRIFEVQNTMPHAKMMTIDGNFSSLGSANMDQRSFRLNFETNLFFYGINVANKLENDFKITCESAIEIQLSDRININIFQRITEGIGRVLAPIL